MTSARQIYLGSQSKPALPYDAEVEYLESTGTQWIDTPIAAADNVGYELRVVNWSDRGRSSITCFFAGVWGSANRYGLGYNCVGGAVSLFIWWNSAISGLGNLSISNGYLKFNYLNSRTYNFNGVVTGGLSGTYNASNTTIRLLNAKRMDTGANAFEDSVPMKFSAFRISRDNAVACDMIPVRFTNELGQSEGAMYDRVSCELFRNSGTGAFGFGTDIAGGGING